MPRIIRVVACLFVAVLVSDCSKQDIISKFASSDEQATARAYLDQIHAHDFAAIERDIDPSIKAPGFEDTLEKMANLPPAGQPTSVKPIGAQKFEGQGEKSINITFEYNFGDKWFLENLGIREKNGVKTVFGLHVVPLEKSLEEQNKFTVGSKTSVQYGFLGAAVGVLILTLYALVSCIRTKHLRRKWLWILFILVGFGSVGVNWTTGQTGYQIFHIKLFSVGASAQLYGPWIISVAIPVGAIFFLVSRRLRRLKINAPQPSGI
jgi:hypothetical protein